jgi:hypothetical protein
MLTGGGASPKASEPTFAISISLLKIHRGQVTQAPDNALTNYQTGTEQDLTWLWRACEAKSNSWRPIIHFIRRTTMYNKQSGSNTKDSMKKRSGPYSIVLPPRHRGGECGRAQEDDFLDCCNPTLAQTSLQGRSSPARPKSLQGHCHKSS